MKNDRIMSLSYVQHPSNKSSAEGHELRELDGCPVMFLISESTLVVCIVHRISCIGCRLVLHHKNIQCDK